MSNEARKSTYKQHTRCRKPHMVFHKRDKTQDQSKQECACKDVNGYKFDPYGAREQQAQNKDRRHQDRYGYDRRHGQFIFKVSSHLLHPQSAAKRI